MISKQFKDKYTMTSFKKLMKSFERANTKCPLRVDSDLFYYFFDALSPFLYYTSTFYTVSHKALLYTLTHRPLRRIQQVGMAVTLGIRKLRFREVAYLGQGSMARKYGMETRTLGILVQGCCSVQSRPTSFGFFFFNFYSS